MFKRRLIKIMDYMFPPAPPEIKKCTDCGELNLIPHLDNMGKCRKCIEWEKLLAESDNIKRLKSLPLERPEPMRTEPAPMLDRIHAQQERDKVRKELDREWYMGQG